MNNNYNTLAYFWSHLKRYKFLFIGTVFILPILYIVTGYLPTLILAGVLNKLSKHEYVSHQVWQGFNVYIISYAIIVFFGSFVLWRVFDLFFWRLQGNVERSIAQDVCNHLISQSADFHANEFSGTLVSRTNKIISAYDRMSETTFFNVAPLIVGVIFVTIVMGSQSIIYAVTVFLFSAFYIISSFFVGKKVRRLSAKESAAESFQTGVLADAMTNVLAIKSFAKEKYESIRFNKATDKTYSTLIELFKAFQVRQIFFSGINSSLSLITLLVAIIAVVDFNAKVATAFLIFNYTSSIIAQLTQFSNNALRNYNRAFGDANEMVEILNKQPEVLDPKHPEKLVIYSGEIEFKNVTFTHSGANDAIFKDFNIRIKDGEKIGLVGHSGAGKSTLTRLIMRFSDIDSGEILIGGQNIAKIKQEDLHSVISYVPQEPLLFHRSILENIAYGDTARNLRDVKVAAKQSHAAEFIDDLPDKYETLVGERGVKLSGGQRQRVAIARAMLKKSPVLLLDEATSALDSESEKLIQDALWKLMEGRTTLIIAHRLSTIQRMDRILVVDKGAIVEQGSHKELLESKGVYAKLWNHQSGGFLED